VKDSLAVSKAKRIDRDSLVGSFVLRTSGGDLCALLFEHDGRRSITFPPAGRGAHPRMAIEALDVGAEFESQVMALAEAQLGLLALPAP
jgi:hypothetical protein